MTNPNIKFSPHNIALKKIGNYPGSPTIIFLHDSLGCVTLWKDFPQRLGELTRCNVLVYDRLGYGKSGPFLFPKRDNDYVELEADLLNQLLVFWKIDRAILFGHSDGGSIALLAAAKYPERILGIITEGAHIFVEAITVNGIREAVALYETTDLKMKLQKYHGDKTEAMFRAWTETWMSDEFQTWNIENRIPLIECSALIIQGEEDEYGTLEQVEKICRGIGKKATKMIIPNVRHTPHKETPELILERTTTFIESLLNIKAL